MMQNHLEISSKYHFWTRNVRNWSKLSYGKLTEIWRKVYGNPRPVQEDLYGPIYGPIWALMGPNPDCSLRLKASGRVQGPLKAPIKMIFFRTFWDFSGPYGPIRAHMGPYRPVWARPGPLKSGTSSKKMHFFFNFSRSLRAGAVPIQAYTGLYGPIWALMGPYGAKSQRK